MKHKIKEVLHFYGFLNFKIFILDENVYQFTPTHEFLKFPTFLLEMVIMVLGVKEGSCANNV